MIILKVKADVTGAKWWRDYIHLLVVSPDDIDEPGVDTIILPNANSYHFGSQKIFWNDKYFTGIIEYGLSDGRIATGLYAVIQKEI